MSVQSGCLLVTLTMSLTVVASQHLLAPRDVQLSSYNMKLLLRWRPPENESRELLYWTQLWTGHGSEPRAACVNTSALHCELSSPALRLHIMEFGTYHASVRAQCGDELSSWADSPPIIMDRDTVIGPPGVSLNLNREDLEVILTEPKFNVSNMADTYGRIEYNISYWPQGHQDRVNHVVVQQNRAVLSELEPSTQYCVQVRVRVDPVVNQHPTEASEPLCVSTNKKPSAPWLAAVLTFIALALAVLFVVIAVVYHRRIGHFLCPKDTLPQHLPQCPRSLSYLTAEEEVYHQLSVMPSEDSPSAEPLRS